MPTDRILDFRARFPAALSGGLSVARFAAAQLHQQRLQALRAGLPWEPFDLGDPADLDGTLAAARVNAANLGGRQQWQGRWIADCPDPDCEGAEYVDLQDPRFMCCSCFNRAAGHRWLPVSLPAKATRLQIEALLTVRPGRFRNWYPPESLLALQLENARLGVPA